MKVLIKLASIWAFLLVNVPVLFSQSSSLDWVINPPASLAARGTSIAVGNAGSVYLAGTLFDTLDADPGPGTELVVASGAYLLAKYSKTGEYVWAFSPPVTGGIEIQEIVVDQDEYLYVTGWFNDTVDIDHSANVVELISEGNIDMFIAKYDSLGNLVWANSIGSLGFEKSFSISVDNVGYLAITGTFDGPLDFDPSSDTAMVGTWGSAIFLAKYDTSGNYIWAHALEGNAIIQAGNTILFDGQKNIIVSGKFNSTLDFDFTPDTVELSAGGFGPWNCYLAKYDGNANLLWAVRIGENGFCIGLSVIVDSLDNIYLIGTSSASADFDPSLDTVLASSSFEGGMFLAKYSVNGDFLWVNGIGGNTSQNGRPIALDKQGRVYVTGSFEDTIDFDTSPTGSALLVPAGAEEVFLAAYGPNGDFEWAHNINGDSLYNSAGTSLYADVQGAIYVTGYLQGMGDFDPSSSNSNTSALSQDFFIAKYNFPDSIVGVHNLEKEVHIEIYPNPTTDLINIVFGEQHNGVADIRVYNSQGRLVFSKGLQVYQDRSIFIGTLPPGIYLFQIELENAGLTRKVIVN